MNNDARTDAMRRHVAAIQISVSGASFCEFLDPRFVLIGAGPALSEAHRHEFAAGLAQQRRHLLYFEFALNAEAVRPERLHLAVPVGSGVLWHDDCRLWTAEGFEEIAIIPAAAAAQGRFVSRLGRLRFMKTGTSELDQGSNRAMARFEHTVRELAPEDLSGQRLIDEAAGGSWFQHFGFAVRHEDGLPGSQEKDA